MTTINKNVIAGGQLVLSQFITQVIDKAITIALIWYVTQHYPKAYLAIFLGVVAIPYLVNMPLVNKVTQRYSCVLITSIAEGSRAICFLLAFILYGSQGLNMTFIIMLVFLKNFAASFFDPIILSFPPKIVRSQSTHKLTSLINSCFATGAILGPLVAVGVTHWLGLNFLFLFASIAYGLSFLLIVNIRLKQTNEPSKDQSHFNFFQSVKEVLLKSDSSIGLLIIYSGLMNLMLGPLQMFIPLFLKHAQGLSFSHYSGLQVTMGVGAILGASLISLISIKQYQMLGKYGVYCYLFSAVFYTLFAFQSTYIGSLVTILGLDLFMSAGNVLVISYYQSQAKSTLLPVLMSCVVFISVALSPISMFFASGMVKYLNILLVLHMYSLGTLIITLITLFLMSHRFKLIKSRGG